jgi:hypothetical protein
LKLGVVVKALLHMVEAWFYGLGNFVYAPSLVVWSKLFAYSVGLDFQSKHFYLWLRFGFMVQALLLMVEVWSYGSSTFVYGRSLVVWSTQFFLCSSLVINISNLYHALIISNYLKTKDARSPSSSLFMHL